MAIWLWINDIPFSK